MSKQRKKLTLISIWISPNKERISRFAYLPGDGRTITWSQLEQVFPEILKLPVYYGVTIG